MCRCLRLYRFLLCVMRSVLAQWDPALAFKHPNWNCNENSLPRQSWAQKSRASVMPRCPHSKQAFILRTGNLQSKALNNLRNGVLVHKATEIAKKLHLRASLGVRSFLVWSLVDEKPFSISHIAPSSLSIVYIFLLALLARSTSASRAENPSQHFRPSMFQKGLHFAPQISFVVYSRPLALLAKSCEGVAWELVLVLMLWSCSRHWSRGRPEDRHNSSSPCCCHLQFFMSSLLLFSRVLC